jgi:hypothetical protein
MNERNQTLRGLVLGDRANVVAELPDLIISATTYSTKPDSLGSGAAASAPTSTRSNTCARKYPPLKYSGDDIVRLLRNGKWTIKNI